jgi:hypothetical protein
MVVIGYKVFNPDWTCRGFQYEVGKTFEHEGPIKMCGSGFHFCLKLSDCFNYYEFDSANKVAVVEAIGDVMTKEDKSVTNKIVIVKELSWHEVLDMCNTGNCNTGNWNTGDCNTGNWNTGDRNTGNRNAGDWNTGDWNTGNWNTGNWNTGNCNTGDCNTGDCNTGNRNTGDCNTGDWNTGDWNMTNYSTGYFNTIEQPLYVFNKLANVSPSVIDNNSGLVAMTKHFSLNTWIKEAKMTEEEKYQHPEYTTTGGYLKSVDYKTACEIMWSKMTAEEKSAVKELPNFDADIFEEITGIHVD